jgi:tetratricopeptide (TPR) repeat protein
VSRELKRLGLEVRSFKQLRLTLHEPSVYAAARWRRAQDVSHAMSLLAQVELRAADGTTTSDSELLWRLVTAGFTEASNSPNQAAALVGAEVVSNLANAGADFDAKVSHLHPVYASRARQLRAEHGIAIDRIVGSIAMLSDRRDVLREWDRFPPTWLRSEASLLGFVGELCLDAGANDAADRFFQRCLELDGTPRGYWKARRVLAGELPRDEALEYLADVEEFPLVRALIASNSLAERETALADWQPSTEIQTQLQWALRTVQLREAGLLDESIEYGKRGLDEHRYTGAGLEAAKSLVQRSTQPGFSFHARDLADALDLALAVRDERRRWAVSSGAAAALAMKVSQMLMDLDRSWSISQPAPEGEATIAESEYPEVRDAAIVLLADRGLVERAREMVNSETAAGIRLQVEALEAEAELETDRANALWSQALAATDDYDDKAGLAFRLATRGVVDPFVDTLRPENSEIADEIETIAALFRDEPGAEARARAASQDSPRVAHALIAKLGREGRNDELAPVAERAAATWGDADDWLRAGRAYQTVGDLDKAIECTQKAIQVGGARWGDLFSAYGLLTELHFRRDDYASAEVTALAAIAERPDSTMARWALVMAKALGGDQDGAYETWRGSPIELPPRTAMEGSVWLSFFRMHGDEAGTVEQLLELVRQFRDDEQIRRLAIGALTFAPIVRQPGQVDLGELIGSTGGTFQTRTPSRCSIRRQTTPRSYFGNWMRWLALAQISRRSKSHSETEPSHLVWRLESEAASMPRAQSCESFPHASPVN